MITKDELTAQLSNTLARQKKAFRQRPTPISYQERIDALDRFQAALYEQRHDLAATINQDYGGRSTAETLLMEIFVIIVHKTHHTAVIDSEDCILKS